ncbi:MAG: gliding motility-associated ABC transporter substrate-binding protein GldG [Pedobacter sp.]|nr:MAG: gliding motility-associated ABC transporter substrate-binding protein GldG [Pedobacter sp.]
MVKLNKPLPALVLLILILALVNLISSRYYSRFDLTTDRRFTLTPQSKKVLEHSGSDITVTVFLNGDLPAAFKRLKNATADLLSDYAAVSKSKIHIVFEDPLSGVSLNNQDTVINQLYAIGIEPTTLNIKNDNGFAQKTVFPMAMIVANGRQIPVKLLGNSDAAGNYEENINNSIQNLEYSFTSAMRKVITGDNPRIGFTEGNGELSDLQLSDAIRSLSSTYEVGRVNLNQIDKSGLDKLKVLFITKPQTEFSEAEKYKINYFIMQGGRVVWSIDQVSADLDSLKGKSEQLAFNKKLNLDDMLFTYGARINYNLIADANCVEIPLAMGGGAQNQIQLAPWIYYPILMPAVTTKLVKNIDGVRSEFTSTVDTIGVRGVRKTPILYTSQYNKVFQAPILLSLQMIENQPDPRDYANNPQIAAVLLEGNFSSLFLNRPLPEGIPTAYTTAASSAPGKMIVIGDGDIFKNQVSANDNSPFPLGFDRYTQRNYGNKALLLNIADYLSNDENLIELRNKDIKIRLLDKEKIRAGKLKWQLINTAFPLLLLIFFGTFQHYYRKHKYAR